jgi:hypothetical protein
MAKGNQSLAAIDKCLTRTPDTEINILENVYDSMRVQIYVLSKNMGIRGWVETNLCNSWKIL